MLALIKPIAILEFFISQRTIIDDIHRYIFLQIQRFTVIPGFLYKLISLRI